MDVHFSQDDAMSPAVIIYQHPIGYEPYLQRGFDIQIIHV